MAFAASGGSFGGAAAAGGNGAFNVQVGPELQEIQTKELGFLSIAGDAKVRLLPTAWPADSLPPSSYSLLSIAPTKGLLAAAGPEGILICSTESLRAAFTAPAPEGSNYKPFKAQLEIPIPQKVSHLAFSSDDSSLVVATADGSGLIVFDAAGFLQNNAQPAFTVPLNGSQLRYFAANPEMPALFAAVTTNGELIVVDMNTRQPKVGPNGPALLNNVSCITWSTRGKQLVAGKADGTITQLTPEGEVKAELPRPPGLEGDQHVSSIAWLENHLFFNVYTPSTTSADEMVTESFYILSRVPQTTNFTFQKLPEAIFPLGTERLPPAQFIKRLRNYEPNIKDLLVILSTSSPDVGIYSRASKSLADSHPNPDSVTNAFTATSMSDDARRAEVPLAEDQSNTSPIGVDLDLSCKDVVLNPIPGEDIPDSGVPLPGLCVLNSDGVLAYWYIVYSDAVKEKKPFQELAIAKANKPPQPASTNTTPAKPAFGQSAFTPNPATSPFAQSQASSTTPFGKPTSSFGQPAFGGLAQQTPTKPSAPSFGSTTPMGTPSFGTPSMPGFGKPSFGQPSQLGASAKPSFGQPSTPAGGGFGASSGIGSTGGGLSSLLSKAGSGGFSSFASASPNIAAAQSAMSPFATTASSGQSVFSKPSQSGFGALENKAPTPFGAPATALENKAPTPFGAPSTENKPKGGAGLFGMPAGGFNVGSSFKPDNTSMDEDKPEEKAGSLSFGGLGNALGGIGGPQTTENKLGTIPEQPKPAEAEMKEATPTEKAEPEPPLPPETTSKTTFPSTNEPSPDATPLPASPTKKEEAPTVPEAAPFPPDPFAKPAKKEPTPPAPEAAPLPPDFLGKKKEEDKAEEEQPAPPPEESDGEDFEGFESDEGSEVGEEEGPEDEGKEEPEDEEDEEDEEGEESEEEEGDDDEGQEVTTTPAKGRDAARTPSPQPSNKSAPISFGQTPQSLFPPPSLAQNRRILSPRSPSPDRKPGLRSQSSPLPGKKDESLRKEFLKKQTRFVPEETPVEEKEGPLVLQPAPEPEPEPEPEEEEIDESEVVREELALPLEPADSLDPFLPHQDYGGRIGKGGIPRKIETLYRDCNAMIDTLGINARSLASYLLYQEVEKDESNEEWLDTLRSERASDLLDGPLLLSDVDKLQEGIDALYEQLREGQKGELKGILADIQQLLGKDLVQLRGQCSNLRRVIDVHTDAVAIASAPLSPEQTTLQQDLRKSFTGLQSKIANLESDLFMLRAKIADSTPAGTSGSRGRRQMGRPSVSAVESTIATIQRMAKEKSASIDMLEAQFRKLGLDVGSRDREDTPAHEIPDKKEMEVFHTMPGMLSGTRRHLRAGWAGSASGVLAAIPDEELQRFKERAALRKKGMGFIRKAMDQREHNVREMNVP